MNFELYEPTPSRYAGHPSEGGEGEKGSSLLLIAMKGLPGCGKSTLARSVAMQTGWTVIDKDGTKDALHGILPDSDAGHRAYAITLKMVETALGNGTTVIYDSPLPFPTLCEELRGIADRTGARLCVIECRCPEENELRRRIEGRSGAGLSPHRITRWTDFLSYRRRIAAVIDYPVEAPRFSADTSLPLSTLTANLMTWLNERFPL